MATAISGKAVAVVPSDWENLPRQLVPGKLVLDDVLGRPYLVVHPRVVGALDFGRGFVDS